MLRSLACTVLLALCAAPAVAKPAAPTAKTLVARLQKLYDGTRDFSASFDQHYEMKALGRSIESSGTVAFLKPGRIRFDYTSPAAKTFAVDGRTLWVFQPQDGQAMVDRCFKADGLTASLVFLGGSGRIANQFDVTLLPLDAGQPGLAALRLVPKTPQGAFSAITLWVQQKTGEVHRSVVEDAQGNPNTFVFKNVRRNKGVKPEQATFTPPKGVVVTPMPGSCAQPG